MRKVDADGKLIQGKLAELSRLIPVTKDNFFEIERVVLRETLEYLNVSD